MKTTIQWYEFEWTPQELQEFLGLISKKTTTTQTIIPTTIQEVFKEKHVEAIRTMCAPCWPKWTHPGKPRWNNKHWPKGQKVWTISVINGFRVEYANQSVCARAIKVPQTSVCRFKDSGKAINWYFITTKHP